MDADEPTSFAPQDALKVLDQQTSRATSEFCFNENLLYAVWGVCYSLGFLPLALSVGPGRLVGLPLGTALGILFAFLAAGIVVSALLSVRATRGTRGASSVQGRMYGLAWCLSFLGVFGVGHRLGPSTLGPDETGLVINGISMMLTSALFMAGGAIWRDVRQFVVGLWISVVTTLALILGLPAYYWLMSLLVGGGLFIATVVHGPAQRMLIRNRARVPGKG